MDYNSDDYLMLSGIQHFYFCKRQWCLIHIEQQWEENRWTMEGQIIHEKSDNPYIKEKRKEKFISRAIPVASKKLRLSGILDVVEFSKDNEKGIEISGKRGKWKPVIIEFKRGKPKKDQRDIVQLVAQVICLEEKFGINIPDSYLYYNQTNQKVKVEISDVRREIVCGLANEMHDLFDKRVTTPAENYKNCKECSLVNICMPRLTKKRVNVENYLFQRMDEDLV